MKVLITGATGFVGSWLTKKLILEGHDVKVLCRFSSNLSELGGLHYTKVEGDITNKSSLIDATTGVDHVFHLAGVVGYSPAMREVMEKVNVGGTQNVVEACLENKISRLVYFSSVVAVGASFDGKQPLNEESEYNVKKLDLGYFETKKAAEDIVMKAYKEKGLDCVALNPSTIYGPGDAKKGSRKTQLKVAKGQFPFYTSGGVSIIAIEDVIQATIEAWKNGRSGERYILSGDNILIKDLFKIIADEAGVSPPSIYLPNPVVKAIGYIGDWLEESGRKGPLSSENAWTSILYHWFDSSKAQKELGLKPKSAREAIKQSVDWIKNNGLLD